MKRLILTLAVLFIGVFAVTPAFAMDSCDHEMAHEATIAALSEHVDHAYEMGHIANRGLYTDLQATLSRAASFESAGATEQAVLQVEVFIAKVQAQPAQVIEAECANHLVMHAGHVIMALNGEM